MFLVQNGFSIWVWDVDFRAAKQQIILWVLADNQSMQENFAMRMSKFNIVKC
jgi:hypothetical protein